MPCCKVTINKSFQCDKAECFCLPTGGKPCICVCEDDKGGIIKCDDCKCSNTGTCQCKCDDSKCTCIVTKGANCICVCRDESGNIKACDCSCVETDTKRCCQKSSDTMKSCGCCKALEKETCGRNCKCVGNNTFQDSRAVTNTYKCDKAECVCIPTGGKSCICICENRNGEITKCDDCKCSNTGTCQCKCDDSKCTCIVTKGADCICVCRDGRGNIKACDCSCIRTETKQCYQKSVEVKSCECCKKPEKKSCGSNCKCVGNNTFKVSRAVNKVYKCDKAECVCIPTGGKSCICISENMNGEITKCDDCKCSNTGTCQYKCDDSKCTCIVTKGADCICVCRDGCGKIKACDCSCVETETKRCCQKSSATLKSCECCKALEKETCGRNCKCVGNNTFQVSRAVNKVYKCDKAECVCIPTGGKSCICICENMNGEITKCDDCTCSNIGTCQCKCDDSKCTCIVTKGADCICVCRDGRGNIKACDCSCIRTETQQCCQKSVEVKSCECCKKPEKKSCGSNCKCVGNNTFKVSRAVNKVYKCDKAECVCIPTGGKSCICISENMNGEITKCDDCKCSNTGTCQCKCDDSKCTCIVTKGADCICVCRDGSGKIKACDCSCVETETKRCCQKSSATKKSCECCKALEKETCGRNCKCVGNKTFQVSRAVTKTYKCDKAECVCIPTGGKSCICICENMNGEITKCDDCKCSNIGTCQCKFDDSKCTCIVTKGADCICVCRDGRGNIKACDCSCIRTETKQCCQKSVEVKSCECCKKPEKKSCGSNCKCVGNNTFKVSRAVNKVYKCDKAECVCIPTGGKSCICICENMNGEITKCDDCTCSNTGTCQCKCDDSKFTCIVTKGADCICVCRDGRGNIKACDCSCIRTETKQCCQKSVEVKSCECCKKPEKKSCGSNCKCVGNKTFQVSRAVTKISKCDKAECVYFPTGGKSRICIYENKNGEIMKYDDCKCSNTGTSQCKCDDSKCTCIVTKGADCVCVCRDGRGNINSEVCDCSCVETKTKQCCQKSVNIKFCECSKEPEKETCGSNCKCVGNNYFQVSRAVTKTYKCDKTECVCIPTGGKSCICICENKNGEIMKCDNCKCSNFGDCQYQCDDSKCTCIVTKEADCICVCRDGWGNIKACDCSCMETDRKCCKKEINVKSCACCNEKQKKETSDTKHFKLAEDKCVCMPTGRKFCVNEDNGAAQRGFCKSSLQKTNSEQSSTCVSNIRGYKTSSCFAQNESNCMCCVKNATVIEKPQRSNEKSCACSKINKIDGTTNNQQGCIYVEHRRFNSTAGDGCFCQVKTTKSCICCY